MVSPATPGLTTIASPGGGLGTILTDNAILTGGYSPTGTITFFLFDPSNSNVSTSTLTVSGNGTYTSCSFTPVVAGMYTWDAIYTPGNGNNITVTAAPELVSVGSSVPEPSTWALILLGFAGLGFAFRRSRRKVSFA